MDLANASLDHRGRAGDRGQGMSGARVLQIGAGFIGCIIMEALAARGVELTVVEMGDRMVPRMMTAKAGNMIRQWVESKGVAVHVKSGVTAIMQKDGALMAKLTTGAEIAADLVICAAGITPNTAFLAGSGVAVERGIRVDAGMAPASPTSTPRAT